MVDEVRDHKSLNRQQTQLRKIMTAFDQHEAAMYLFMNQHAMLHSAKMAKGGLWSYEDEILDDMTTESMRRIPAGCEHSVLWCIWHIARIEDVAMNVLVADSAQVLHQENWRDRLNTPFEHTGNAMDVGDVEILNKAINVDALRAYRVAVGRKTRKIVKGLPPGTLKEKVDPSRIQRVREAGAVLESASGIIDYWRKRNIAGLLLMPATRHNLVHLNEATRLKKRR